MDIIKWDGKPITRPGIYSDVPIEVYHDDPDLFGGEPHVSSGGLRTIESPDGSLEQFFHGWVMNPEREEKEEVAHFSLGQACHTLFLGEGGFREKFAIRPETYVNEKNERKPWSSNATVCKDWLEEERKAGRAVLKADDFEVIKKMAAKLGAHPAIQAGMLNGLIEKSIFWFRDVHVEGHGVVRIWLKARPDVLPTDSLMVVDYKTTADASANAVRRSITDFGYHQQLALIQEGVWVTQGLKTEDHVLVFQEKKAPFSINVKPLFGSAIHAGHLLNNRGIGKLAGAIAKGEWPGYEDDGASCDLMDWRVSQLQNEIKLGLLAEDYRLPERYVAPAQALPAPADEADLEEAL